MTTKVLVVNFGPDNLDVQVIGKDQYLNEFPGQIERIFVQQSREFYVHGNQDLKITEVAKTPNTY